MTITILFMQMTIIVEEKKKRNDTSTTIFIQLLYNFLSHTDIIFLFSLFLFLSLSFLTSEKREQKVIPKVIPKELFKYDYSKNIEAFMMDFINQSSQVIFVWISYCQIDVASSTEYTINALMLKVALPPYKMH